jgi:hypothetical protein
VRRSLATEVFLINIVIKIRLKMRLVFGIIDKQMDDKQSAEICSPQLNSYK